MTKTNREYSRGLRRMPVLLFAIGFMLSLFPIFTTFAAGNIFKVTNAEIISISDEATADIFSFDDSTIYSKVVFHHIDDEATYKIRILNSSPKDYTISSITDDNTNPYISYIYDTHNYYSVPAGDTFDFEVTAKYTTGVTDMNERVSTSTVRFFINFIDKSDEEDEGDGEKSEEIDFNPAVPNTGVNLITKGGASMGISLTVLIICALGLVISAILVIRKHSKSSKIILAIAIAASIITVPTVVTAATTEVNVFTITTEYHLMDKLIVHHGSEDTIINYGTPLKDAEIAEPENPGHSFVGWEDEDGNLIDPEEPIREDTTIVPRFVVKQYAITFDTAGGSEIAPIYLDYGETVTAPADPTRTGYTFAGWNPEIPETMPAENITVTAQWTVNQYTITFDTAGGSEVAPITQDYNTEVTAPADPTRTGYTFAGWNPEIPETMPAENITVTAQWTVNQYTITFDTAGGSEVAPITQDYNTEVTAPADPSRVGYTFAGWDPEIPSTMPAEDITVTAQWIVNQYTITFDTAGGSSVDSITQDYGTSVTAPADPTRTGYTFAGWSPEVPETMPAENITVVAQWNVNQYTITFDTAGGSEVAPITQDFGTNVTAPADPTRTGYTFAGWTPEIPETMPAENITVTAQWTVNQYTITFDTAGGSEVAPITQDYNTEVEAPADPTKTGYTFAGWNPEVPATMPAENITVVAQWTVNQYTITFDTAGGSSVDSITQDYNTEITAPADPTRTGYTFAGWDPEIPETMPAENITVTAQWTVNQYTITFDTTGGSEVAPITQDFGTNVTAPADPTKTGYTFAGWSPEIPTTMPAENITVTAQWTINQYTITFDTAGGSEVAPITQDFGTNVTAPADPTRTGYAFAGWNPEIPETMPAENITVTAQWNANQIIIHFDKNNNDATGTMEDLSFNYDAEQNLPSNNFSLTDYYFGGWNTEADGSGTSYANEASVKNINTGGTTTLYAQWIDCPGGNVCYKPNGATADGTTENPSMGMQAISGSTTSIDLWASNFKNPIKGENNKKAGFAGWNTKADGTGTSYGPNETISITAGQYAQEGLALYAMWVESVGDLQGWTGCSALNTGDVIALTDTRDGETYAVAKLADGNCWMVENLRLNNQYTTSAENIAKSQGYNSSFIGLADPETANFTNSSAANSLYSTDGSTSAPAITGNNVEYRFPRYNNQNISSPVATMTNWKNNLNTYNVGNYYTWAAAIADTSDYASETHNTTSICPASWSIPIGGQSTADNSFGALSVALGGPANGAAATDSSTPTGTEMSRAFRSYPNNFIYSGGFYSTSATGRGSVGFYWSSTVSGVYRSDHLKIASSHVYPGTDYSYKGNGRSIRCLMSSAIITFDKNATDATGEMASQEIWPGVGTNLNANTFTREHYVFNGWNTKADGSGTAYADGASITLNSSSPVTLYAQWAVTPYTIIFDKNAEDATGEMANQSVPYGEEVNLTANAYTRESYYFNGWNTKADGSGTTYADEASVKNLVVDGEVTLYAQWTECPGGNVCYKPNGATADGTTENPSMGLQAISRSATSINLWASNFKNPIKGENDKKAGFAGWNTKADGTGTKYGPNETISITAGQYSEDGLSLYAMWVESAGDLQGWTGCGALNTGDVTALTDTRDGETYAIAKLADGNCWMVENLRLNNQYTTSAEDIAKAQGYNSSFVGLANPETENFANSIVANSLYSIDGSTSAPTITGNNQGLRFPRYNNQNVSTPISNMTGTDGHIYSYGNYYTFAAATANTSQSTSGTSICPASWHLPQVRSVERNDFWNLVVNGLNDGVPPANNTNYSGNEAIPVSVALRRYPNNFIYAGHFSKNLQNLAGFGGSYWVSGGTRLYLDRTAVYPGANGDPAYYGLSIRCLVSSAIITFDKNATDATGEMANQEVWPGVATNLTANTFTREHYAFSGWNTAPDGSGTAYDDEASITLDSASPITLYAQWAVTPYTIIFNKNAEDATGEMVNQSVPYDETVNLTPNAFARDLYNFSGWNTKADGSGTSYNNGATIKNLVLDGEITLYAQWAVDCKGIVFYANGGEGEMSSYSYTPGSSTPIKLPASNFSREGYGFAGWNTKADGSGTNYGPSELLPSAPATCNLKLYANWVAPEQSVTMQTFDPFSNNYANLPINSVLALDDIRDNNSEFDNVYAVAKLADGNWWMIENLRLKPMDADIDSTNTNNPAANFATRVAAMENEWDTTAVGNNATAITTINYNSSNINRDLPPSQGRNVMDVSWYSYGVLYNWHTATAGNGGYNSAKPNGDICPAGWHLPDSTAGTGDFTKLDVALGGTGSAQGVAETAVWSSYPTNIVHSGAYYGTTTIARGVATLIWGSRATSEGAARALQATTNAGFSPTVARNKYEAFAVRCIASVATVNFDKNADDATGEMTSQKMKLNTSTTITANAFTREHYAFSGWNTAPDGSGTAYDDEASITLDSASPITLYAQWAVTPYTIVFDKNSEEATGEMASLSVPYGETISLTANAFTRESYYFNGWNTAADGSGTAYADKASVKNLAVDGEVTLYAHWVECPGGYVCYKPNGATADGTTENPSMGNQAVNRTATSIKLLASNYKNPIKGENNKKAGFAGWNTKADGTGTSYGPSETISIAAGQYAQEGLALYAMWVESAGDLQSWTGCSALGDGAVTALTDNRDNNTYAIAKLADGNCWMIENLRLADKDDSNNAVILSATNTNAPALPLTNVGGTTSNSLSPSLEISTNAWCTDRTADCNNVSRVYTGNTETPTANASSANHNIYSYGNYYNWYSATAGNNSSAGDICPAGWHLPYGGSGTGEKGGNTSGGFYYLGDQLGIINSSTASNTLRSYPNNFVLPGSLWGSAVSNKGIYAFYSTNTPTGVMMYSLRDTGSNVNFVGNNERATGLTARCVTHP